MEKYDYKVHLRTGKIHTIEADGFMMDGIGVSFYDEKGNFLAYPMSQVMKIERTGH